MTVNAEKLRELEAENTLVRTRNAELRAMIEGVPNNVPPAPPVQVVDTRPDVDRTTPVCRNGGPYTTDSRSPNPNQEKQGEQLRRFPVRQRDRFGRDAQEIQFPKYEATRKTSFSLVYDSETVIPIETRLATIRSENPSKEQNNQEIAFELDHLDEHRERAALKVQAYQPQVARHYYKNVRISTFKIDDWVLRGVFQNAKEQGAEKLGLTCEGPYQITNVKGRCRHSTSPKVRFLAEARQVLIYDKARCNQHHLNIQVVHSRVPSTIKLSAFKDQLQGSTSTLNVHIQLSTLEVRGITLGTTLCRENANM
ncbi:hypothetical protein Dsin_006235 [Dipteronia sinensis]|uniref:Uncharacterized protein n=1 Tax=Dipteronia sinensis TaxID=43782 RepID=A0AAE0EFD6_9ROSI|nr:hypothetical protein Dsin_006235 [Dipteronia sinensis]